MTAMLELRGVTKSFAGLRANNNVSLTVDRHECHAVIGPNGAGKSTLVAQIAGELAPDEGRVLFETDDVTGWSVPRRARWGLARSFQMTELLKGMTAEDNVALAIQARRGHSFRFFRNALRDRSLREPARAALETIGLGDKADIRIEELSHGERRQVELAIALAAEPKLMLLDEPMAGLGSGEAARMIDILTALKGRMTILFVEHDMAAVFALADRISVLVAGAVICTGTPDMVRADAAVQAAYLGNDEDI